jgi:hypothetical protein
MGAASHEPASAAPDAAVAAANAERLSDLQLAFNLYPATYVHPSWLERWGGVVIPNATQARELQQQPLWIRALSSALLRSEQLDQHFDCDFFDPAKRLALLDATTLTRVAGVVSATLLRQRLQRVVSQTEVGQLHACMAPEAHAFAVRWAGPLPALHVPLDRDTWPTRAAWERACVARMFAALPAHAIGVIGRLRMRFPREWNLSAQRLTEPQRAGLTRLIVAVILESAPQWGWLFEPLAADGEERC